MEDKQNEPIVKLTDEKIVERYRTVADSDLSLTEILIRGENLADTQIISRYRQMENLILEAKARTRLKKEKAKREAAQANLEQIFSARNQ